MKLSTSTCFLMIFLGSWLCANEGSIADTPKSETLVLGEAIVLFDGQSLDGWQGREDLWTVENSALVGRTSQQQPLEQNTFLIYKNNSAFRDFELTLQFKIEGGNSGVQYRSRVMDAENSTVGGYQADIDFENRYTGILYEEKGRGVLAERGDWVTIDDDGEKRRKRFANAKALGQGIHPGQWNDLRVVARGNHLEHYINGAKTMDLLDNQASAAAVAGCIALQLHRGPAMTVRFKKIVLVPYVSADAEMESDTASN